MKVCGYDIVHCPEDSFELASPVKAAPVKKSANKSTAKKDRSPSAVLHKMTGKKRLF